MWYTIIAVREDGSNITIKVPNDFAGMAEQADARDLKSRGVNPPYRFDSGFRHQHF